MLTPLTPASDRLTTSTSPSSLSTILMMARDDAILLVAGSDSFVSELLSKIWQDVRVLWEWDGRSVLPASRERLRLNR